MFKAPIMCAVKKQLSDKVLASDMKKIENNGEKSKILSCVTLGGGIRLQVLFYPVLPNFSTIKMHHLDNR